MQQSDQSPVPGNPTLRPYDQSGGHRAFEDNVAPRSVGAIVRAYKSAVALRYNRMRLPKRGPLWQRNYYEHIIRDTCEMESINRYTLDIACGTGKHLEVLQERFAIEGLDLNAELLEIARERLPNVPLHLGDMERFDLGRTFDVVTCLFSSIGYLKTLDRVTNACVCVARHLNPGGVLLVEPWFTAGEWHPGTVHALFVEEPELKIARVNTSLVDGRISYFDLHYLIGTPQGTEHLVERHELGLFEQSEMRSALESAGLRVQYDAQGLTGRGLWIGEK